MVHTIWLVRSVCVPPCLRNCSKNDALGFISRKVFWYVAKQLIYSISAMIKVSYGINFKDISPIFKKLLIFIFIFSIFIFTSFE